MAAAASLLAAAPLSAIFDTWTWLLQCTLTVGLIAGAAVLARTLRFPTWAQAAGMALVLLLTLTWMFPSHEEIAGLIPTPGTFAHFGELFSQAGNDTRSYGVPVPDRDGLLFVAALGIGAVAIVVDLLTVVARRPALAGLPMLAIYSVPVAVYIDSVPVLPFIVGAIGYLWLLVADNVDRVRRFGRRFTGDGRDVDVWEPSPLAAAGRRLAVIGVAAAVALPVIVPGLNTGLLNRLTNVGAGVGGSGTGGGGNGRINLFAALSGQLTQTTTTNYVKVTTTEPNPFYLRFGTADVLNQDGFVNRTPTGRPISRGLSDPRTDPDTDGGDFKEYHAEVEITNDFAQALAPVYGATIGVDGLDGAWSYDQSAQTIFSSRSTTRGQKYSFDYVRATYTPGELREAQSLPSDNPLVTQFTAVPKDLKVERLVDSLTKSRDTQYDKMMALYRYFSKDNGFSYSLTTADPDGGASAISAFLDNKAGYCQQYAAALAWMARVAGMPARVAFGFTRGSTRDGNAYVLTNRNAHAWTEVYFEGFGWIPFDATPAADVVGSSRSAWAPDNDQVEQPTASSSATAAPGAASSAGPSAATRPDRDVDSGLSDSASTGTSSGPSSTALLIAGLVALLIALLLVPSLRRVLIRRRRHAASAPAPAPVTRAATPPGSPDITVTTESTRAREDAHAAWDELVDTMLDYRVPLDATETPRHTAQRLIREADLTHDSAAAATLLGHAEERARYARQPLRGEGLTTALTHVRKGLAATASRRTRLEAVLLPPSVLLRWRLTVGDLSTRWATTLSNLRDSLTRFSPRRLLTNRAR
ncbi:transglutaminase domain-containing protein [Actinoplanes sp. N902-109]|nr:transglutaminase domain-containing protein [Actinoplanes sp. N902-109]